MLRVHPICVCFLLLITIACLPLTAQEVQEANDQAEQRKARMETMKQIMSKVQVFVLLEEGEEELKRSDQAVTHYRDDTRDYEDGTLWAFTRNGRPLVLTTCYTRDVNRNVWTHATTSLTDRPMRCTQNGLPIWTPLTAGVRFKPLPDGPDIATKATSRQQQIRQLARRFKAWQFWNPDNQRSDLRRQPRPIMEYADPSADIVAGAAFLFTHGINPELVLLIEAAGEPEPKWRYSFAKIGSAEFHATLDDAEVYQSDRAPGVVGRLFDPYFMFFSRM